MIRIPYSYAFALMPRGISLHFATIMILLVRFGDVTLKGEDHPATVMTVIAEKSEGVLRTVSLTGTVTARRQARLSSRATGLVMEMRVDAGDLVKRGDVLMTLDTRLAEIALELIQAEMAQGRIELEEAHRQEKEVRELVASGGFAKTEAETLKSTVRIREANLKQLEAKEREQIEMIARHQLVAPFGGVVSRKLTEDGEWVPTGTPVLELVETESPRFDLQVPQEFLTRVSAAEKVVVKLDAHPGTLLEATIDVMVPVKDTVSRTFLTRLEFDDPQSIAAPGMSGTAEISFRPSHTDTVQIPRDAVVRFPDGTVKVWIVSGEGENALVESRVVRTGGTLGELTEVVEGLEGGERVVLKGNEGLRENQPVNLRDTRKAAVSP